MKKKMVFDASIIAEGSVNNYARTGIYFVTVNLLRLFIKTNKFEIYVYCDRYFSPFIKKALSDIFPKNNLKFLLIKKPYQYKYDLLATLRSFKQQTKKNKKRFIKK